MKGTKARRERCKGFRVQSLGMKYVKARCEGSKDRTQRAQRQVQRVWRQPLVCMSFCPSCQSHLVKLSLPDIWISSPRLLQQRYKLYKQWPCVQRCQTTIDNQVLSFTSIISGSVKTATNTEGKSWDRTTIRKVHINRESMKTLKYKHTEYAGSS